MNEQMLLQKNWTRVVISPDADKDFNAWDSYIKDAMQPDQQHHSYDEWSDHMIENETFDIYVYQPHSMFMMQFIEEELSDEFAWKYEIKDDNKPLQNPLSFAWSNYYYEDEDNCIITLDDNFISLISGKA